MFKSIKDLYMGLAMFAFNILDAVELVETDREFTQKEIEERLNRLDNIINSLHELRERIEAKRYQ